MSDLLVIVIRTVYLLKQTWLRLGRKDNQIGGSLALLNSKFYDFDQDVTIRDAANNRQQNSIVIGSAVDREFTANNSCSNSTAVENTVIVQTLQRRFNKRIHREMVNIVHTVEDRIQNAILAAMDNIINPSIELVVGSINASSRQNAISVMGNSEHGERIGITTSLENVSERNNICHELNTNDETHGNILTR